MGKGYEEFTSNAADSGAGNEATAWITEAAGETKREPAQQHQGPQPPLPPQDNQHQPQIAPTMPPTPGLPTTTQPSPAQAHNQPQSPGQASHQQFGHHQGPPPQQQRHADAHNGYQQPTPGGYQAHTQPPQQAPHTGQQGGQRGYGYGYGPPQVQHNNTASSQYTAAAATQSATEQLSGLAPTRQSQLTSTSGTRGALNKMGLHVGLSKKERAHLELVERIRTPLAGAYRIPVLALKGGVGKSVTTVGLGSTLAHYRSDRVIAVDANNDFGNLDRRAIGLAGRDDSSYREVVHGADHAESYGQMRSWTSVNNADLEVLRSGFSLTEPGMTADEFDVIDTVLSRHYNLMLTDCGTAVRGKLLAQILSHASAAIVVADTTREGVQAAAATIDWLRINGFEELLAKMVIVINTALPGKQLVDVSSIVEGFSRQQRPVHVIPWDPHIAEGDVVDLRKLKKKTVAAYERLAASVADEFSSTRAMWR